MGATWVGRLATLAGLLLIPVAVRGQATAHEGAPQSRTQAPVAAEEKPAGPRAAPKTGIEADAERARADAQQRLKSLGEASEKGGSTANKALRGILEERLQWLKAWDEAAKARREAEHPEPNPERQAAEGKADLEHVKTLLDEAAKNPDALLPGTFRNPAAAVPEPALAEMKEAIEGVQNEHKEWAEKLGKLKAEPAQPASGRLAALRADRDKTHQRVATLKARRAEREGAVAAAKTAGDRALALERLINFQWESRVEEERLGGIESRLALETKLSDLAGAQLQLAEAHVRLARKSLDRMQASYRALSERRERALERAAADQENRAAKANDPVERYRASRLALLLELEAQITKSKNAWATSPFPALEDQTKLADAADNEFASIRKLLDDGRVSHLDALRLNNDFRRIGPERARIVRRELSAVTDQVTRYENALSDVELALVSDGRDDQFEFEALLERLPVARHLEAKAAFDEIESRHAKLLAELRKELVKLASRAEQTHEQVLRRLKTLDDEYGFIRTHMILVRDREPINAGTFQEASRDLSRLGKGVGRLALEAADRKAWGRVSAEFVVGFVGIVVLPWPFWRARRALVRWGRESLSH